MRGAWMLVGGFVGGLLACTATTGFACMEDSECSLSGEPGVCAAGNCAYPSETCESGYVYPDGAPGKLAGMCADVEGGTGSLDTGTDNGSSETSGSDGGSTGGTTVALDGGTTSDDTTTSASTSFGSSDSAQEEAGEESSSGGCNSIEVFVDPIADAFMTQGCQGPMDCSLINHGATDQHPVGETPIGEQFLMALRFDAQALLDLGVVEVQSAELELYFELDDNSISGTLQVLSLSSEYEWVEGMQSGEMAADGESCWEWAQFQLQQWPDGGPLGAVSAEIGQVDLDDLPGQETIVIPLDPGALVTEVATGADSLLVSGPVDSSSLFVFSRESGLPPMLHLIGC